MKKNNSGFSLVELIIVIAIMAVLIGVLAPQFIKYVERSRVSTDKDNAAEIVTALQVYAADEGNPTSDAVVSVSKAGGVTVASPATNWVDKALENAGFKTGDAKIKSTTASWKDSYTVTMKTDGSVVCAPADIADSSYDPSKPATP